jgi:hypothetical protein
MKRDQAMTPDDYQEFKDSLRAFLQPTIRGKIRALSRRLVLRLFPVKETPRFRVGDILSFNEQEKTVAKCRGRFVEFTDGSEMVVA